jgi:hypothetical protein
VIATRIVDKKPSLDFLHLGNPKTFVQPLRSPVKFLEGDAISDSCGAWGQPFTYDFSVITEKGVTTSSD